jgi:hypothetical protein
MTPIIGRQEACGLMLEFRDNLVTDISFYFMFANTDNPYLLRKNAEGI